MDQCGNCTLKGNLEDCKKAPRNHHETWYAKEQQKKIDLLENFVRECRDNLLYPLSHEVSYMGIIAEGLGSATVDLLKKAE